MRIIKTIISSIIITVGLFLSFTGFTLLRTDSVARSLCTEDTVAAVVGFEEKTYTENVNPDIEFKHSKSTKHKNMYTRTKTNYLPILEYDTVQGTTTTIYYIYSTDNNYNIGDQINIKYDPNNVDNIYITDNNIMQSFGITLLVIGTTIVGLTIIIKISKSKKRRKKNEETKHTDIC